MTTHPADDPDETPAVSVLIAAYEVSEVLPRAVESALSQLNGDVEVVIVDDASPSSATRSVARDLATNDPRVRLLEREENGGPGAARADALEMARGAWVAVLDADDRMLPGRLDRLLKSAVRHEAQLVADNLLLHDPMRGPVGPALPMRNHDVLPLTAERVLENCVPGGKVNLGWLKPIVSRPFLVETGVSWREFRHAEDVLFTLEVLSAGAKGLLVGNIGYEYTERRGSLSGIASPHSRTLRNADEQIRAFDAFEANTADPSRAVRKRLDDVRDEIQVTSAVLSGRDALAARDLGTAVKQLGAALRHPRALVRCSAARYGPRSRQVV